MSKLKIAVLFGGRSTEHEVSIITALQVLQNLDQAKYDITPIYVTKSGTWLKGDTNFFKPETFKDITKLEQKYKHLKAGDITADVVFPIFHGTYGEDGTIQGLLELLNLPYVGPGVLAAATSMDKVLQKHIFLGAMLPQVKFDWFYRGDWHQNQSSILTKLKPLRYPLYVKPANGGSSIGITKAKTKSELIDAIDVACFYDRKILIEESFEHAKEINISVLGNNGAELQTSVLEQPISSSELLTFSDKYESNSKSAGMASTKRLIPAPVKMATKKRIEELAKTAFSLLECSGVARLDFLVSSDEKTIYINEINTIPGSLAFYLWTPLGMSFSTLLDQLITLALDRHKFRSETTYTFSNNLLQNFTSSLKTGK